MKCPRCTGMRVPEVITDGGSRALALRCVHCGDIVDRVIAYNRRHRRELPAKRARTPVFGDTRWRRPRVSPA